MKSYTTRDIRNVVLVGGKGGGKTSILDNALYLAGLNTRVGSVDDGSSMLDTDPQEIKRKQTIFAKPVPIEWKGKKLNFIDAPGYADFIGEAISAIYVSDVVVAVVDASSGVDIGMKRHLDYAKRFGKPLAYIINKAEGEHVDVDAVVKSIKELVSNRAVQFVLPIGKGAEFSGVVDLLSMKAYSSASGGKASEVPPHMKEAAEKGRTAIIECVAELDEALMDKYLGGQELSEEEIKAGIAKGMISGDIQPVFITSASKGVGIDVFLDAVASVFPDPSSLPSPKAISSQSGEEVSVKVDSSLPFSAYVFKVTSDPGIGDIFFFRVYSGKIEHGADVYNTSKRTSERMGHLFAIRGKGREDVAVLEAGDIGAVAKLKASGIGDTLSDKANPIEFAKIEYPEPLVSVSVKPKSKQDQDKLGMGFSKFMSLDPTFTMKLDKEFNETIISGIGETHLEVMMERLKERFGIDFEVGKPRVPYRETIQKTVKVSHRHKKQTGGRGQYGECYLEVSPLPQGSGFVFEDAIVGGAIPSKYIPAVEKGVREAMSRGALAGYPVVDVKVKVFDGSYHEVDSSDLAFQIAGSMAFKKAESEASPILLEPIMNVEVTVPSDYVGDVTSDISSRRGRVIGMEHQGGLGVVKAEVPLAELYRYSTVLRSMTSGAGSYTMSFARYEPVPAHIAQKIIEESKKLIEEEKEA